MCRFSHTREFKCLWMVLTLWQQRRSLWLEPPPAQRGGAVPPPGRAENPPRAGKPASQQQPRTPAPGADTREADKKKGFLVWTGARPLPPYCQVRVQMQGMTSKERICIPYASVNCYCSRGGRNPCTSAHVNQFKQLPAYAQTALDAYVQETDGLDYAPGQGPPGTK